MLPPRTIRSVTKEGEATVFHRESGLEQEARRKEKRKKEEDGT